MALITYPLNNINYTAEDAELYNSTRTSGIFANNSFDYSVIGADTKITIGTGIGWIKNSEFAGKVIALKEALPIELGLSDSVYPRIDAVVIQFDANANATNIIVKKGTASTSPIAPEVVRTETIYELHLYQVQRAAGSTTIVSDDIIDTRLIPEYCGLMEDAVTPSSLNYTIRYDKAQELSPTEKAQARDNISAASLGFGYGEKLTYYINEDGTFETTLEDILSTMDSYTAKQIQLYDTQGLTGNKFIGTLWKYTGDYATLEAVSYTGAKAIKTKNSTWQPWEWVNPPLADGVVYRTIKRVEGKPVYVQFKTIGKLPNAGQTQIAAGESGQKFDRVLTFDVFCTESNRRYKFPFITSAGEIRGNARFLGDRSFYIETFSDLSGYSGMYYIEYTLK